MIDVGFSGIFLLAGLIVLASLAGIFLSSKAEWGARAQACGLPLASGAAFGPFLLGLAAIAVLLALPGRPHSLHLAVIALALAAPAALGVGPFAAGLRAAEFSAARNLLPVTLTACAAAVLLLALAVFTPLTQNDALEYEIVARRIYELRALSSYPMIDPAAEPSGFFAPWTHPPLYTALLYVAQATQGHAASPALERLIAPWALIAAGAACAALARMRDRRAGGLAFLALLAPPLVFLGAAGALIDSLTMLGMALAMAFACAGGTAGRRASAFTGAALGAAMWAHSQAALLLPMFSATLLFMNWRSGGGLRLRRVGGTLLAAALIGSWPYVWNLRRFGALASDALAFVAPNILHWDSYFAMDRGISSALSKIVYGLLKIFTAPEAYGLLFALALAGAAVTLMDIRRTAGAKAGDAQRDGCDAPALTAVTLCAVYLAGVCASLALGRNDLIKNERYLLIIAPPAAILAALLLAWFAEKASNIPRWAGIAPGASLALTYAAAACAFLLQFAVLTAYALSANGLLGTAFGRPFETTLGQRAETALAFYMRSSTPASSVVLSLKPADMYYAERRMVSHFDPRLKEFYAAQTPDAAYDALAALGVSFVHLPNYAMPTFYNSKLKDILSDPLRSTILFENGSGQIYGLSPARLALRNKTDIGFGSWPWETARGMVAGGRKRFARVSGSFSPLTGTVAARKGLLASAFERHAYAVVRMGAGGEARPAAVAPNAELVARFEFSGVCHISLIEHETRSDGGTERDGRLLAMAIVEDRTSPLSLPVRFRTGPGAKGVWFELVLSGGCALDVKKAELLHYDAN